MSIVGEVVERKDRPAYVRFERVPVEDKEASLKTGHYVAKDVDYALITPPYSKDVMKHKASQWLVNLDQQVQLGRIPKEWADDYKRAYEMWKKGQEMPLKGTPIRGWGVISPAQQETLIRMKILTVEDLECVNDEGMKRIGMGAMELKNKASAWLKQLKDKGPLTQELASLKTENEHLKTSVENLRNQVEQLKARLGAIKLEAVEIVESSPGISASDILDEPTREQMAQAYKEKFGKKPHPNMKDETLKESLK